MNNKILAHYEKLAHFYDDFWVYSPNFISFLTKEIIKVLELSSKDILVDLGCGTGIYTQAIINQIALDHPIICVDRSPKMVAQIPTIEQVDCRVEDALNFAHQPGSYSKILIKELIHHIDDPEKLLEGLFNRLIPGGILLLILLPPKIEYPLFTAALSRYEALQPHYQDLVNLMQKIGFESTVNFVDYPLKFSKDQYLKMVENCYLSVLSTFNEEELRQGIIEMEQKYTDIDELKFVDRFVFIKSYKP